MFARIILWMVMGIMMMFSPSFSENAGNKATATDTSTSVSSELIQTLEDEKKRGELIDQLKKMQEAQETLHPSSGGVIHALNGKLVFYVEYSAHTLYGAIKTLANFPRSLWQSTQNIRKHEVQDQLLDFTLVLLIALSVGFVLESLLRGALQRVIVLPPLPFRFVSFSAYIFLTLLPLILFVFSATFTAFILDKPRIFPQVFSLISVIVVVRALLKYFKILVQPHQKMLRILPLSDQSALRFYRLVGIFTQILICGALVGQCLQVIGLSGENYHVFKGIIAFGLLLTLAALVLDYKSPIARWLSQDRLPFKNTPRIFLSLIQMLSRTWHMLAIGFLLVLYMTWMYQSIDSVMYLLRGVVCTILLFLGFRFLQHKLTFLGQKWSHQLEDISSSSAPDEDVEFIKSWRHGKAVPVLQSAYFLVPFAQFFLYLTTFILLLQIWGLNLMDLFTVPSVQEYFLAIMGIVLVGCVIRILWGLMDMVANSQLKPRSLTGEALPASVFAKTIVPIVRSTLKGVVAFIGFLIVLSELNIDVKPILYLFSVASLAISFGAQTMVKDIITGFFTLFEGNIAVGELVTIGAHTGVVEAISLRSVFIRHGDGSIQSIPFSEVQHIINKSRDYCVDYFEVATTQETPIEKVFFVLEETYEQMKEIDPWKNLITSPMKICGVDRFSDTSMVVLATVRSKPEARKIFMRAFYAKLQDNLRRAGIKPPAQQQVMYTAAS